MRKLLLPIAFFYHIILTIRHKLYDWHLLKSKSFDVPVIGVGNLALGGTGKTPHTEYLIEMLKNDFRVATLSRGYGRNTKGFKRADISSTYKDIGDEPLQYYLKYPEIQVTVDEDRVEGVTHLLHGEKKPEVILLDDAFQHRRIEAGLNIVLTAYDRLYCDDHLVPAGTLRDVKSAAQRADIIVVTKAPNDLDSYKKAEIIGKLNPKIQQNVYFSSVEYGAFKSINPGASQMDPNTADAVLLFCGIAHPEPLVEELKRHYSQVETMTFTDHHPYSADDVNRIAQRFQNMKETKKIIVTTEKDVARIIKNPYLCRFERLPLFAVPIKVKIDKEEKFKSEILNYVRKNYQHC